MALGAVAVVALLASPAGAQTTTTVIPPNLPAGSTAINGSVSSGTAYAQQNSTASGDSVAINNSTASGCADAVNNSTASGSPCPGGTTATTRPATGGGATTPAASATAARLALTGSWSGEVALMAALAIALGAGLVVAGRRRNALQG